MHTHIEHKNKNLIKLITVIVLLSIITMPLFSQKIRASEDCRDLIINEQTTSDISEANVRSFVTRLYRLCLKRQPDVAGLNSWVNALTGKSATGTSVAYCFVFSDEYLSKAVSNEDFLTDMYTLFFDRKPDNSGYTAWLNLLNNGTSRESVFEGFCNSVEFYSICKSYGIVAGHYIPDMNIDNLAKVNLFVNRFYNNVLGRECDISGMGNWTRALMNQSTTGAELAYGFIFSQEYIGKNMCNSCFLNMLYTTFMNRTPDEAGKNAWLNLLNNGTRREDVFNGFVLSTEFARICDEYGIQVGDAVVSDTMTFGGSSCIYCRPVENPVITNTPTITDTPTNEDVSQPVEEPENEPEEEKTYEPNEVSEYLEGKTVAVFGDSVSNLPDSWVNRLISLGIEIDNYAIDGSAMSTRYSPNGYNIIMNADLSAYDVVFIAYGTNDWSTSASIGENNTTTDYKFAMEKAIEHIEQANPNAEIILVTPTFTYRNFNTSNVPSHNYKGMTVKNYVDTVFEIAQSKQLKVIDFYYSIPVDETNYKLMLHSSSGVYVHPIGDMLDYMYDNLRFSEYRENITAGTNRIPCIHLLNNYVSLDESVQVSDIYSSSMFMDLNSGTIDIGDIKFDAGTEYRLSGYSTNQVTVLVGNVYYKVNGYFSICISFPEDTVTNMKLAGVNGTYITDVELVALSEDDYEFPIINYTEVDDVTIVESQGYCVTDGSLVLNDVELYYDGESIPAMTPLVKLDEFENEVQIDVTGFINEAEVELHLINGILYTTEEIELDYSESSSIALHFDNVIDIIGFLLEM